MSSFDLDRVRAALAVAVVGAAALVGGCSAAAEDPGGVHRSLHDAFGDFAWSAAA